MNISIIIPCRNEEKFIANCLNSLIKQTYSANQMEILVVDGSSTDNTRDIIKKYQEKYAFLTLFDNSKKIVPSAMNIGIRHAKGKVIMKADAHTTYPETYIEQCIQALNEHGADNVGGVLETMPSQNNPVAKAIAASLMHPFGVGSSPFRKKQDSQEPREVDTVAFGCFKREVFERIGYYNEDLVKSSDMELNMRLKREGGKIFLIPSIKAYYYADATFHAFLKHNITDGFWATYPLKFVKFPLRPRHFIPLAFVTLLILLFIASPFSSRAVGLLSTMIILYLATAVLSSISLVKKEKNPFYALLLPAAFAARHFGYGFGSLWGLYKLFTTRKP